MITDSFRNTVHNALVQINDYFRVILESELGTLRNEIIKEEGIDYEYGCKVLTMDEMKKYLQESLYNDHTIITFKDSIYFDPIYGIYTKHQKVRDYPRVRFIDCGIRGAWTSDSISDLLSNMTDVKKRKDYINILDDDLSDERFNILVEFLNGWSKNKPNLNKAIKQKVKNLKSDWNFKRYINTNFNARREEMNHIDLVSFHV